MGGGEKRQEMREKIFSKTFLHTIVAAPPAALQVDAPVSEASAVVEEMMDASIVPPPP